MVLKPPYGEICELHCFPGEIKMMRRQPGGQEHLFYSFDLESVIPEK